MARQIVTVDEIRPLLDLKDESEDDLILIIIEGVTDQIEKYCNRTFESGGVSYSETYDGNNGLELYLNHRPIISVSSLVITDSAGTADIIPSTDYKLYLSVGKIKLTEGDTFLSGDLNVAVTYLAGESALPPMVRLAAMKLIRWHKREWTDDRDGITSVSVGEQNITYGRDIPVKILKMLDPYRVHVFG